MAMKLAIIGGAGTLGSCTAFTLALQGLAEEIVMLDTNRNLLLAHIMDITSAIAGKQNVKLLAGSDNDLSGSDIVIVLAGVPHLATSTHEEMIQGNLLLTKSLISKIEIYCPKAVIITATNPVDSINLGMFLASGKLNRTQLLGYNLNDSLRFIMAVANELGVKSTEVEALALGEHVTNMALVFSSIRVNKKQISLQDNSRQRIKTAVPAILQSYLNLGINRTAGWTSASGIAQMVHCIANDSRQVFPCSAVVDGEYGYKGISIGVPVMLGRKGIDHIIELQLTADEQKDMDSAARELVAKTEFVKATVSHPKQY
jgi:malate dehydrogenase